MTVIPEALSEAQSSRLIRRLSATGDMSTLAEIVTQWAREGSLRVPELNHDRIILAGILLKAGRLDLARRALSKHETLPSETWTKADALIIDPGFVRLDGHHANTNHFYFRQLEALGLHPALLRNTRTLHTLGKPADSGLPAFQARAYMKPFGDSPDSRELMLLNDLFHDEFQERLGAATPRVIVAHTLRHTFVEGFCRFLANRFATRPVTLLLGVVETDVLDVDHPQHRNVTSIYLRALKHLSRLKEARILFVVERPELRTFLERVGAHSRNIVEAPYVGAALVDEAEESAPEGRRAPCIGFVGQTRPERGPLFIPALATATLDLFPDIQWLIQMNQSMVRRLGGKEAVSELDRLSHHPRVRLLGQHLPTQDYLALLRDIDIMVLPYADRYRFSGSGITMESLRSGHVQVLPEGSSMAQTVREAGGEPVTFAEQNHAALLAAVTKAVDDHAILRLRNQRAAMRLREQTDCGGPIQRFLRESVAK